MVIEINIKKAGIFIKPIDSGKFAFKYSPDIKKPNAPNKAMNKPIAAALPMALFIEYPKYLKIGTFIIAPPIPIGAEINPETNPNKIFKVKLKFGLRLTVFFLIFKRYVPKK